MQILTSNIFAIIVCVSFSSYAEDDNALDTGENIAIGGGAALSTLGVVKSVDKASEVKRLGNQYKVENDFSLKMQRQANQEASLAAKEWQDPIIAQRKAVDGYFKEVAPLQAKLSEISAQLKSIEGRLWDLSPQIKHNKEGQITAELYADKARTTTYKEQLRQLESEEAKLVAQRQKLEESDKILRNQMNDLAKRYGGPKASVSSMLKLEKDSLESARTTYKEELEKKIYKNKMGSRYYSAGKAEIKLEEAMLRKGGKRAIVAGAMVAAGAVASKLIRKTKDTSSKGLSMVDAPAEHTPSEVTEPNEKN